MEAIVYSSEPLFYSSEPEHYTSTNPNLFNMHQDRVIIGRVKTGVRVSVRVRVCVRIGQQLGLGLALLSGSSAVEFQ